MKRGALAQEKGAGNCEAGNASCCALFKRIHDEMEKTVNNEMRVNDLTMAQSSALALLLRAEGRQMTLKELERALHVAQSTAAGIACRLEQKGFVESFGSSEDRRIKMLRLTDWGAQRLIRSYRNLCDAEQRLLSPLTSDEQQILLRLLQKISREL